MTTEKAPSENQPQSSEITDAASASRRRFTKSSLAASGVLMTLASRSSLAAVGLSPSGFCSINQSTHGQTCDSQARTPGYWKTHSSWPSGATQSTLFRMIFPVTNHSSGYYTVTLGDILTHKSYDVSNLGMHLTAAYLDALKGWSPFLPTTTIVTMWNEWSTTGFYKPTATISWDAAQIVTYLTSTEI